jgi:hypothetical protein
MAQLFRPAHWAFSMPFAKKIIVLIEDKSPAHVQSKVSINSPSATNSRGDPR